MFKDNGKYYVYRHVAIKDPHVFYIGLGSKNKQDLKFHTYTRAFRKDRSLHWKRKVDKYGYEVEILLETDDRDFCVQKEIEFISLYGREDRKKGRLINKTDGGEYGALGRIYKPSKESIEKMRKSLMGKKMPESFRKDASERMKGNKYRVGHRHSPKIQSKISKAVQKPIYVYDLLGNFVEKFESVKLAAERFNVDDTTIIACAKGKQQQSNGFQFRYFFSEFIDKVKYKININSKILHIDLSTGIEIIYNNAKEASEMLNIPHRKIIRNAGGESKTTEGNNKFKWVKDE